MKNDDIRKIVDGIVKSHKTLEGITTWRQDPDGEAWRWLGSVAINDEQSGITLIIKYYPRCEKLRFSITLNLQRCFWRLDFGQRDHLNPLGAPSMAGMIIRGPHYHPWDDNRKLATANSLPKRLRHARLLPESIKGFQPAFRWFVNETNIYAEPADVPDLPKRDTLL